MKSATPQRLRPVTARRLLALVVALACGWVAYALYGAAAQDRAAQSRVSDLQAADAALQSQIDERSRQVAEAQSSAWIEEQLRKLGYHMPGEHVYVLDPGGRSVPTSGGIDAAPPTYSPTPTPTPPPTPTPTAVPASPVGLTTIAPAAAQASPPVTPTPTS